MGFRWLSYFKMATINKNGKFPSLASFYYQKSNNIDALMFCWLATQQYPSHLWAIHWWFLYFWSIEVGTVKRVQALQYFLLTVPRRRFFCGSFLLFVFRVCQVVLQPCGHPLGNGWPLGSLVCDVFLCFCHFLMWSTGSGVVLDCIDSWSLPSSLLYEIKCSFNADNFASNQTQMWDLVISFLKC